MRGSKDIKKSILFRTFSKYTKFVILFYEKNWFQPYYHQWNRFFPRLHNFLQGHRDLSNIRSL